MNKLQEIRILRKYNKTDLARISGVSRITIRKLEKTDYKAKRSTIERIAAALNMPYDDLEFLAKELKK
jgi:DNA-binding XRE family transcriptional regulator